LQHEFGVHPTEMEWFMERTPETSHGGATGFIPPPGIRLTYVPVEDNIGEMLLDGRLDALLFYAFHGNEIDRSTIDVKQRPEARMLFPDPEAEGRRYFAKTGIYPINHCMVVRRSLAEEHPWVIPSLYDAFCTAQNEKARVEMPYGIRANRTVLETIATYLHEQGLTDRVVRLDEVFAPSMFDR
jgi:4,5-dihydroxyphthalate decarboxylase